MRDSRSMCLRAVRRGEMASAALAEATEELREAATEAPSTPPLPTEPSPQRGLRELMEEQRKSLDGAEIVASRDYLALAKPIASADAHSRPGTAASRCTVSQAADRDATDGQNDGVVTDDKPTDGDAEEANGVIATTAPYSPPRANQHLHVRDTLSLALRVLEVNRRDGNALDETEVQLVEAIAAFARRA